MTQRLLHTSSFNVFQFGAISTTIEQTSPGLLNEKPENPNKSTIREFALDTNGRYPLTDCFSILKVDGNRPEVNNFPFFEKKSAIILRKMHFF